MLRVDGEKWYTIQPKRTQTWAVIRSQRFLKLEGKSFHTSLFFISLFVLTFVRLHCVYCVGTLSIILHIIIVVAVRCCAAVRPMMRWCVFSTCYSVTSYLLLMILLCRCRHRARGPYERNNAQKKIKVSRMWKKKNELRLRVRIMTNANRKTADMSNCRGVMHWSIRDFLFLSSLSPSLLRSATSFRSIFYINILSCYHFLLRFDLLRFDLSSALLSNFIVRFDEPIDYCIAACTYSNERGKHFTRSIIKRGKEKYEQKCMQRLVSGRNGRSNALSEYDFRGIRLSMKHFNSSTEKILFPRLFLHFALTFFWVLGIFLVRQPDVEWRRACRRTVEKF